MVRGGRKMVSDVTYSISQAQSSVTLMMLFRLCGKLLPDLKYDYLQGFPRGEIKSEISDVAHYEKF
jgi:hypothetical protein